MSTNMDVSSFYFDSKTRKLTVLNQLLLPKSVTYVEVPDSETGYSVIKRMMVRGAPCIAAVGCLSIIAELNDTKLDDTKELFELIVSRSTYINGARPTAVNLRNATDKLVEFARSRMVDAHGPTDFVDTITKYCLGAIDTGLTLNRQLGDYGANEILAKANSKLVSILTHCNTGSLATVGYGTALGVIRSLHKIKSLKQVYCTETRPYNQGSRLTAWELVRESLPVTLIADSMAAYLMASHKIDAVIVGADCVAANGDTANKIGTLQLAVTAKHYHVPFYVAAPLQSISDNIKQGNDIEIELRPPNELRSLGETQLAPMEVDVWNPCFDVTPAELITGGIITEKKVYTIDNMEECVKQSILDSVLGREGKLVF